MSKYVMIILGFIAYETNIEAFCLYQESKKSKHPGMEALRDASAGESIIFRNCEKSFTKECAYLDAKIVASINYYKIAGAIEKLEKNERRLTNDPITQPIFLPIIRARVQKQRNDYPAYAKKFSDTLSVDEQKRFGEVLQVLTQGIKNEVIWRELKDLNKAFRGYGPLG